MSLASLIALALAQAAAPPAVPPAPPANAVPAPQPVRICREGQRNLGTHVRSGRVCKTAEEWEAQKTDGNYIPSMTIRRVQDANIEGLPKPTCC